ncbi:hypothetical protein ACWG0P_04800 [Amedibacillus sp. YH-ame6]
MITIKPGCYKPMSCSIEEIKSVAYDGCDYALLSYGYDGIIRLDENLCKQGKYSCAHHYDGICFDRSECYYYAFSNEHPSILFCLDLNFRKLKTWEVEEGICAISVHPTCSVILLVYEDKIVFWDRCSQTILKTQCVEEGMQIIDIIAIHDGYCLAYQGEGNTYIEVISLSNDCSKVYRLSCSYHFEAMVLKEYCMNGYEERYEIQIFVKDCSTNENTVLTLEVILSCDDFSPIPNPDPTNITCEKGVSEVIHSIALEEAGIAHILNAEGEKLQKAVASDISIEELLMVNESVRKTITQITLLEGQLYSKLESLHCLCENDER